MTPRKPGTCLSCGSPTQRTSNTRCHRCRHAPVATTATAVATLPTTMELTRVTEVQPTSLESLCALYEIDPTVWRVQKWAATQRVNSRPPSFTVKATLVQRSAPEPDLTRTLADWLATQRDAQPARVPAPAPTASGYLLELMIPDLHLGKLAWGKETGGQNYDSKIAQRLFREAVDTLVHRTSAFPPERIVLVVGNDFFHSDTKAGTTTKGTPLDVDGRFQKMFAQGRLLITDAAERLAAIAPVTLIMCRGNHDELANYCLGEALSCYFHNTNAITVVNDPTSRKYLQYGRVMLMWTHGDKGKLDDLPLLMATEQPAMFGATTYRECHTGDKHQLMVREHMGVRVRISPALCSADAWHSEQQYVGNQRAAEAFVWSKDEGLISQATYTVR
jgi:hypothetical protein